MGVIYFVDWLNLNLWWSMMNGFEIIKLFGFVLVWNTNLFLLKIQVYKDIGPPKPWDGNECEIWEDWRPCVTNNIIIFYMCYGLGRSPGEGNGNQLQYPCLKNPMDREAWWATVQRSQRVGHNWMSTIFVQSWYKKVYEVLVKKWIFKSMFMGMLHLIYQKYPGMHLTMFSRNFSLTNPWEMEKWV